MAAARFVSLAFLELYRLLRIEFLPLLLALISWWELLRFQGIGKREPLASKSRKFTLALKVGFPVQVAAISITMQTHNAKNNALISKGRLAPLAEEE